MTKAPLSLSSLAALATLALANAASAQDIVLGASVQLTGPVANTGRYYRDAYQLAIDKINAAGGVKVAGKAEKLALKLYDNQSDVNLSVRQYTQLVSQDKVNLLLGPFASNFALADSAVSEKYRVPTTSQESSHECSAPHQTPQVASSGFRGAGVAIAGCGGGHGDKRRRVGGIAEASEPAALPGNRGAGTPPLEYAGSNPVASARIICPSSTPRRNFCEGTMVALPG